MIFVSAWMQQTFKTEEDYKNWLATLQEDAEVMFQEFVPASDRAFDSPIEHWRLTKGRVSGIGNKSAFLVYTPQSAPLRQDGKCCYWGSDREWGEVFPARIVPLFSEFNLGEVGESTTCHAPIYAPEFTESYRHVYFVPYGTSFAKASSRIRRLSPRHYSLEVEDGDLYHTFSPENVAVEIDGVRYCYGQHLSI